MSSRPVLKLDWCSHQAAKYAVEHWHYSKRMPVGPMVKIGAWESEEFIGCILFARGANYLAGSMYSLSQVECCELVRVALCKHHAPVSRIIAIGIRFLKKTNPGLRLIISYADEQQGHLGGIYQAGNWNYVGRSQGSVEYLHAGRWKHSREIRSGAFGSSGKIQDWSGLKTRTTLGKHKYLMALDAAMQAEIAVLARPYPKRVASETIDTATFPVDKGGETPTATLQKLNRRAAAK